MKLQLSTRLQTIASRIPEGSTLCDVGCDHGYLPIWAVSEGVCQKAYALDVRKGPLERAAQHVAEAGLEDRIILRLSDGLDEMHPGEADVIVISGMGGPLMEDILTRGADIAQKARCLVLSPQSHLMEFRSFLCREGYHIISEDCLEDEGKHYFVMTVEHRDGKHMELSEFELRYGLAEPEKLAGYLKAEKKRLTAIRDNLLKNSPQDVRLKEIDNELMILLTFLP
ncbi:MAG: class I SAM-dependent methyltransferase [Lachnospiraceae bacterium]|nr:class I SAM-dependent methyltransferase [Lachnospiraceae bacterium]